MAVDTLEASDWDVVIAGTGLPQSLLALALSRSGKKILHVDQNDYYGGSEAALSLSEAETWAEKHSAIIAKSESLGQHGKLAHARAYSLAMAPQLLYARSALLPALVSSRTHTQLDFQAVGSWFIVRPPTDTIKNMPELLKVPGGREDVFQDENLDLKAKRSLMKLLRYVTTYEEQESWHQDKSTAFPTFLTKKFALPAASLSPILALTASLSAPQDITTEFAVTRVAKHLSSIGLFGPGFGALLPKWGGLAEVSQVACRACAVGGGVYVLNKGVKRCDSTAETRLDLRLSDGEAVTTTWLVGCSADLPSDSAPPPPEGEPRDSICRSVSIISTSLASLFPPTAEGGVTPVGAVVMVVSPTPDDRPVYILVHSSDSGECPSGQSVLYASVCASGQVGFDKLTQAVSSFLRSLGDVAPAPEVLWSMGYVQHSPSASPSSSNHILALSPLSLDLALQDSVLDDVKAAWHTITQEDPASFMRFEARDGLGELENE